MEPETNNQSTAGAAAAPAVTDAASNTRSTRSKGRKYYCVIQSTDSLDSGIYTEWVVVSSVPKNSYQCTFSLKEAVEICRESNILSPDVHYQGKTYGVQEFHKNFTEEAIDNSFWKGKDASQVSEVSEFPTHEDIKREYTLQSGSEDEDCDNSVTFFDSQMDTQSNEVEGDNSITVPKCIDTDLHDGGSNPSRNENIMVTTEVKSMFPATCRGIQTDPILSQPSNKGELKSELSFVEASVQTVMSAVKEIGTQHDVSLVTESGTQTDSELVVTVTSESQTDLTTITDAKIISRLSDIIDCLDNSDRDRASKHEEVLSKTQQKSVNHETLLETITKMGKSVKEIKDSCLSEISSASVVYKSENDKLLRRMEEAHNKQTELLQQQVTELQTRIAQSESQFTNCREKMEGLQSSFEKARAELDNNRSRLVEANNKLIKAHENLQQVSDDLLTERSAVYDLRLQLSGKSLEIDSLTRSMEQLRVQGNTSARPKTLQDRSNNKVPVKFTEGLNPSLSAYHESPVKYGGHKFHSAEACIHYQRLHHPRCDLPEDEKERLGGLLLDAKTGKEAKEISKEIPYNESWERDSVFAMYKIIMIME